MEYTKWSSFMIKVMRLKSSIFIFMGHFISGYRAMYEVPYIRTRYDFLIESSNIIS
jgi:hypothetical protein